MTADSESKHSGGNAEAIAEHAARALAEVEAIYESAPIGLALLDADLRFIRVNRRFAEMNGWPVEAHIGKTPGELNPEIGNAMESMLRRIMETGEPLLDYEVRGTTAAKPGIERIWNEHWIPLRDRSGRVLGASIAVKEITQWKRSEEALANALERVSAHFDNSPLGAIEFDDEYRVVRWSEGAQRIFGWSAQEVLGRRITEMRWIVEDDLESIRQVSRDMLSQTRPRNVNVNRNYRKDGSIIECEWYNSAVYNSDGKLTSVLSQVLETTDRKRNEERLRQAQKMESIGVLAGGMAHDFNNLLTGILGNVSMVRDEASSEQAEKLNEALRSAERAAHMVRQLLAYSGKGQFLIRELDISEAVHEISDLAQFSIPRSVELAVNLKKRLPLVKMDPGQLQQIVMNLVINAGEAIGDGTPGRITISTSMSNLRDPLVDAIGGEIPAGRYVCLEVGDTGCGIDLRIKPNIFDPFFSTKFTGRGLGLAAVAGIVKALKGAITLESAPGRGSTFRVLLPAVDQPGLPETDRAAAGSLGTVLVAENEASVRRFIVAVLRRHGYRVIQAADGNELWTAYTRVDAPVGAVVLDVALPELDLREVLPRLMERNPAAKVLLTSGYSEAEARRLCNGCPAAAFIQKPYTAGEIVRAVERLFAAVN